MTPKMAQVLTFMRDYKTGHGVCPSYREISLHLGDKSPSNVYRIVEMLVRSGHVRYSRRGKRHHPRSLLLTFMSDNSPNWEGIAIAVIEEAKIMRSRLIAAGIPVPAKSVEY